LDIVENNLDKPWNFNNLSQNPNLTFKFVLKYQNKFDGNILYNQFKYEKERIYNKYIKPYIIRIQRCWRKYYYSVEYAKKYFERKLQ
jgi:hypothetical protein